jgi:hypothetical protein
MLLILVLLLLLLFGGLGLLLHPLFWIGLILVLLVGGSGYYRGSRSHW